MKITVNGKRYDLDGMINLGVTTMESGGVRTTALYFGQKSHRLIHETYSIWQRGNSGCCIGKQYEVVESDDPQWVDVMQYALDNCNGDHESILIAATDVHSPALSD